MKWLAKKKNFNLKNYEENVILVCKSRSYKDTLFLLIIFCRRRSQNAKTMYVLCVSYCLPCYCEALAALCKLI